MALAILDADEVRAALKRRKLTQRQFSKLTGIHPVQLSRILNGQAVTAETVSKIAKGLQDTLPYVGLSDLGVAS